MTDEPTVATPATPAPAASPTATEPTATPAAVTPTQTPAAQAPSPAPAEVDLRKAIAGADEGLLKQLNRYQSKEDFGKAHKELRGLVGELKRPLKPDAKPEEVAAWRKDNGIPETPDKYDLKMPEGLIIGEEDKGEINGFLAKAHSVNASPEFVNTAVASFLEMREAKIAEIAERDSEQQQETVSTMKDEWGADYKMNMNLINTMLQGAPEEIGASVLQARMPNGKLIGNDPAAARWLAGLARELNPAATVVPSGAEANMETVASEMKTLESKMGTTAYTKEDSARYLKLTEAKMRHDKKAS